MSRAPLIKPISAAKLAKFRTALNGIAELIPAKKRHSVLIELLAEIIHQDLLSISTNPALMRGVMEITKKQPFKKRGLQKRSRSKGRARR